MDTVNDEEKEDSPATNKDHLRNCWKVPSSGNTTSISSTGDPVTQLPNHDIIQCANKQLTKLNRVAQDQKVEWEKEAKVHAKERDNAEQEISSALEKLQNAANQSNSQGSVLSNKIQQLFEKPTKWRKLLQKWLNVV
eukprot:11757798-Ditylum_brightwellii.AAC.1